MNLHGVTLYPYDDGSATSFFFDTKEEAEAFARAANARDDDTHYLGGGGEIYAYPIETTTVAKALDDLSELYGWQDEEEEEGDEPAVPAGG